VACKKRLYTIKFSPFPKNVVFAVKTAPYNKTLLYYGFSLQKNRLPVGPPSQKRAASRLPHS
jgi:hypothetical protein